jgi:ubiquinone/menaquinone biosynthesis C-methylase UbiE
MSKIDAINSAHLRNRWRERRLQRFMALVDGVLARQDTCRIIDVGGTMAFWHALRGSWEGRNLDVTMVNVETEDTGDQRFRSIAGDARQLPFEDMSFDMVHSNSVIEHVGRWSDLKRMAG